MREPLGVRARSSEGGVDQRDEVLGRDDRPAPGSVEICGGFGGENFFQCFPGGLFLLDAVARGDEHIAVSHQGGLVAQGAVAGDNLGVVVGQAQRLGDAGDDTVDATATPLR
jgi:hypothetical protein